MTTADTPQTLSSAQTFFMKAVFPVFWISAFGALTVSFWVVKMRSPNGLVTPESAKWLHLGVWVAGSGFILWMFAGLKRVRVDKRFLYISNYRHEISVPFDNISDVTEICWINIHPVTIHFYEDTEFGDRITFLPTMRFFAGWTSHPVVAQLRQLAKIEDP